MSRDRPTYLMRNTVKILVGNVLTCKAPHFKFLINFNEKYWFKLIFRDVYDSTPKQIKMSTPLATCKVPFGEIKWTAARG